MHRTLALLTIAAAALAAGCSSPAPVGADAAAPADLRVGDFFLYAVAFPDEGGALVPSYNAAFVVTESRPDAYVFSAVQPEDARFEAAYGTFFLGEVNRTTLATTWVIPGAWNFLSFPLTDGKTWNATVEHFYVAEAAELTFTAAANSTVATPAGPADGFTVTGRDAEGRKVVEVAYAPAVGHLTRMAWFSTDFQSEAGAEPTVTVELLQRSSGWKGIYHTATANVLADVLDETAPVAQVRAEATVGGEATWLVGSVQAYADAGASVAIVRAPDGSVRAIPNAAAEPRLGMFNLYEPAVPGVWQLDAAAAGETPYAYAFLAEVTDGQALL